MQTATRNYAAATLLAFASAGAFLAQPVQAQQRAVVARPAAVAQPAATPLIERFVMRPMARLVPGRELRFRVVGAPGAQATLDIPGVVRNLAMNESRPGVYEAEYTIRRSDRLNAFGRSVATLQAGNQRVTARLDTRVADTKVDEIAPRITAVTPGNGQRVDERRRTSIQARLTDEGSGVDPASVRLTVDGLDVTADARVAADAIEYHERLGRGPHRAELMVKDRAGNKSRMAWTFRVT